MRVLQGRRPNIAKLQARGDVRGLVRALVYEDPVVDRDGRFRDLGTEVRLAAVTALADLDGEQATAGLIKAMADPEADVRIAAVQSVGRRSGERADGALIEAAAAWRDPDEHAERRAAADALSRRGEADVAARVATRLLQTAGEAPGEADAAILRQLARPHGTDALDAAIHTLIGALAQDAVRAQRLLATLAPESVEALVGSLGNPLRSAVAARALGAAHDSRAVGALSDLLRRSGDPEARAAAAWALGEIRDPAAVEALLVASGDGYYGVRVAAADAFDRLGNVAVAIAVSVAAAHGQQLPVITASEPITEARVQRRTGAVPQLNFRPPNRHGGLWRRFAQRTPRPAGPPASARGED